MKIGRQKQVTLPTLTSWVKVASPFYLRWYLTGNKWFIQFISVSLWLAAQRTQRSQSQGSRAWKGKRNESWLPLSSPVITPIKSRWLRPQLAFFQCSMIGWSLGCYPLTASTYPGDDDDIYIMMKCLCVCLSRKMINFLKGLSVCSFVCNGLSSLPLKVESRK